MNLLALNRASGQRTLLLALFAVPCVVGCKVSPLEYAQLWMQDALDAATSEPHTAENLQLFVEVRERSVTRGCSYGALTTTTEEGECRPFDDVPFWFVVDEVTDDKVVMTVRTDDDASRQITLKAGEIAQLIPFKGSERELYVDASH
jgi:hypothetical protein